MTRTSRSKSKSYPRPSPLHEVVEAVSQFLSPEQAAIMARWISNEWTPTPMLRAIKARLATDQLKKGHARRYRKLILAMDGEEDPYPSERYSAGRSPMAGDDPHAELREFLRGKLSAEDFSRWEALIATGADEPPPFPGRPGQEPLASDELDVRRFAGRHTDDVLPEARARIKVI